MSKRIRNRGRDGSARIKEQSAPIHSAQDRYPIFSLSYLTKKFCLSKCQNKDKVAFVNTLHKLSKMTWNELHKGGRHQFGYELIPVTQLAAPPPSMFGVYEKAMVFRFKGKAPMAGFRCDNVFHIIWLDPKFELYKH